MWIRRQDSRTPVLKIRTRGCSPDSHTRCGRISDNSGQSVKVYTDHRLPTDFVPMGAVVTASGTGAEQNNGGRYHPRGEEAEAAAVRRLSFLLRAGQRHDEDTADGTGHKRCVLHDRAVLQPRHGHRRQGTVPHSRCHAHQDILRVGICRCGGEEADGVLRKQNVNRETIDYKTINDKLQN